MLKQIKNFILFSLASVLSFFGLSAHAAVPASVTSAITDAVTDVGTVGGLVIGVVVIVFAFAMMRKPMNA